MKFVLWGINYAPEATGIGPFNSDLCNYLVGCGHTVAAVTAFPYYPQWRKRTADRGRAFGAETIAGVTVHRCSCYVPARVTTLRRIVHELSFGLSSTWRILCLERADVYVVVSPPLALGFFAWVATRLKRSRFVFHVQDLQPDAAVGLGMLPKGGLITALYQLERLAYAKAALVSGISDGMMAAFRAKGVPVAKRALLPNWLHQPLAVGPSVRDRVAGRRHFGVDDASLLAVYAGNLGRKQNLEILVEAAAALKIRSGPRGASVQVIIAGDGAARPDLEACIRTHPGLSLQLLPLLNEQDYAALLAAADVALITQAAGTGQFFFPSKLLSVLAAGLPVVAVADVNSELARAVADGGFGVAVSPGDAAGLAAVLWDLAQSRVRLDAWTGRTGWVRRFSLETVLPQFEAALMGVAQQARGLPVQVKSPVVAA
jgi:colanic acid biosynthesis glycosyl transferase WcaI